MTPRSHLGNCQSSVLAAIYHYGLARTGGPWSGAEGITEALATRSPRLPVRYGLIERQGNQDGRAGSGGALDDDRSAYCLHAVTQADEAGAPGRIGAVPRATG